MYNNFFYGSVNGNIIEQVDQVSNTHVAIGHTNEEFEQLMSVAEQYKSKLEDAGIIEKKLTPEQAQARQNDLLEKMISKFENIEKRLSSIEGDDDDKSTKRVKSGK